MIVSQDFFFCSRNKLSLTRRRHLMETQLRLFYNSSIRIRLSKRFGFSKKYISIFFTLKLRCFCSNSSPSFYFWSRILFLEQFFFQIFRSVIAIGKVRFIFFPKSPTKFAIFGFSNFQAISNFFSSPFNFEPNKNSITRIVLGFGMGH